ncbi:pyridoxal-phosphate dependent enzyme [bacterium]|nr:pyridoxal-phosphate dependent enzyme [bacterium]
MAFDFNYNCELRRKFKLDIGAQGFWRYRSILPLPEKAGAVRLGEMVTALTRMVIGDVDCYFKHDYQLPTGSFKDRGAALLVSLAKFLGAKHVVEDSSGNAGASVAAYCARADISCKIFVPESTSAVKTRQIEMYGAHLERVPGRREAAARAALDAADEAFYASHYMHPLFFHGVKTIAYEIWEQMRGKMPESVVVPVGNGSLLLGIFMGFKELVLFGMTKKMPVSIGVQASQCSPVCSLYNVKVPEKLEGYTIAEGIAIAEPFQAERIVEVARESHGQIIGVSEEEINSAYLWAWSNGFCIEKTSAVSIAGVIRISKTVRLQEPILTVLTGHGLKMIS